MSSPLSLGCENTDFVEEHSTRVREALPPNQDHGNVSHQVYVLELVLERLPLVLRGDASKQRLIVLARGEYDESRLKDRRSIAHIHFHDVDPIFRLVPLETGDLPLADVPR